MIPPLHRAKLFVALAAACAFPTLGAGRSEEWTDAKGGTFEAEPSEVLGPWALFDNGTLVPLNLLSDADCVRFYQGLKDRPQRAPDWRNATSKVSAELYGRLLHYKGDDLEKDVEAGRPEPEFYMIFYTTNDKNMTWNMLRRSTPDLYARLVRDHPDMVQGVVFGVGEELADHMDLAVNTHGEWMYTLFATEVEMRTLKTMIPTNLYGIVVMTRDGIPLFGPDASTEDQVKATFDNFAKLLDHAELHNTHDWIARAHYFSAVQPVAFATGHSDPLLMGNPLVPAKLRQMRIYRVDATFHVAASGEITAVDIMPGEMPTNMMTMFSTGFKRGCLFVPAVDNGKFVDGTYAYHMEVTP